MGKGNQSGQVAGLFSSFTANDPQLVVEIDRDRARSLGLPIREVTDALQVLLGSQYVNDFDFNNRAYRVYVQADQRFRGEPANLRQYYARASNGADGAARHGRAAERDDGAGGHQPLQPVPVDRDHRRAGAGRELGPGDRSTWSRSPRETLPPGFDYAWAGQSLEEIKGGSTAIYLFALSILLVYLVLAAQYESWVLPFIILLGVPLAVFGALSAQLLRGFSNDVFCQVGLVMLDRPGREELDPDRRVRRAAARSRACRSSTRPSRPRASGCGRFS